MHSVSCSDCFHRMTAYRHVRPHKSVPFLDNTTQMSTCSFTKKKHTHTHPRARTYTHTHTHARKHVRELQTCQPPATSSQHQAYINTDIECVTFHCTGDFQASTGCLLIAGIFIIVLPPTATLYQDPELPSISNSSRVYCFHKPIRDSVFAAVASLQVLTEPSDKGYDHRKDSAVSSFTDILLIICRTRLKNPQRFGEWICLQLQMDRGRRTAHCGCFFFSCSPPDDVNRIIA